MMLEALQQQAPGALQEFARRALVRLSGLQKVLHLRPELQEECGRTADAISA
jgi:hypothetical protein